MKKNISQNAPAAGRYQSVRALQARIDGYFSDCQASGRRCGIFGLYVFLGVTEDTFEGWESGADAGFSRAARLARYRILSEIETGQDDRPATLCSLALKNIGQWNESKKTEPDGVEVLLRINGAPALPVSFLQEVPK